MKLLLICLLVITGTLSAQTGDSGNTKSPTKIFGTVKGEKDSLIEGANIVIEGTIDGATTDEKGNYEFETEQAGSKNIIITAIGYAENIMMIEIESGKEMNVNIKLTKDEVKTEEILVTASSYTSGTNAAVTLTPLEIVRIPGADADLYRAITTFPGSNQVNEGSRITVRGGDPDEVLTVLDLASLYNPFIFDETFNVSSYSTINPWGLKGINFTSGGFSAKYGNVLSAVLDLKSYDMPQGSGMFAWVGLANASLSGVYLSRDGKFGGSFSAGKLFLQPYLAINGEYSEYSPIPESNQIGGTLSYKLGTSSNLKAYANYSDDKVGIRNQSPSFDGFYESSSNSYFGNVKLITGLDNSTVLNAGISISKYDRDYSYGLIKSDQKDIYAKGRVDITKQINNKIELNTGLEYEYDGYDLTGIFPQYQYNIRPGAQSFGIDTAQNSGRAGIYAETQIKPSDDFFVIPGIRTDYHTLSGKFSFDPRLSFGYRLSEHNIVRGALGYYHQYPGIENYLRAEENDLDAQNAIHYILGYEFNSGGDILFRVEGYYKDYSNLVLTNPVNFLYTSEGEGNVKGVDMFFKVKIKNKFTGWISYAYTDSKRKQYEATKLVPANYDITNNLSVVGSYNATEQLVLGAAFRVSTGKPYTPVIASEFVKLQEAYKPIYAEINSGRFPTYTTLDMNAQYIFSLFGKFAVGVIAVNNVFNKKNLYNYTYNVDYSQRIETYSNNRRSFYAGLGLQL
ncbi:MAG: TonB-dependent receptor [Ignavibacteria bacterium]|nr:TonB-dependent receptor [Ignavibacteria bacterium]